MKRASLLLAALLMTLSLSACAPERNAVKDGVNDVTDAVQNGVQDMEDGIDNAGDEMKDMIDDGKVHDSDGDLTDGENPQSKP